jgi:hypothetical protein
MNRRNVLQLLGAAIAAPVGAGIAQTSTAVNGCSLFRPQQFGAKNDGTTLDSPAINVAIDRASAQGGGIVYLSPGIYLCGTIVLKSRVTLYLEAGAVILGSKDISQYTPQPGPKPNEDANQRHLLFAKDAEDITLAGPGLVDGQGPSFWYPSGRRQLPPDEHWRDVATFDWKVKPRVSPMLEFVNCRRLRVEQVRIENASGWTLRLMSCAGVVIDGIYIKNPVFGPNTDGIDITNSSDVRIANCSIETGDDAICLKSQNPYGDTVPSMRNVAVTNCTLSCCCNAFKFGTSTQSGFENIVFSNSTIHNTAESDLNARVIAGIALEMVDGGFVDGVVITGIRMQRTRTPIFLRLGDRAPSRDGKPSFLRGIMISDIHATESVLTNSITGLPGMDVEDVTLSNIHIETREAGLREWVERDVAEVPKAYPEARMFGRLPAYGMYIRHARGIRLRDVVFETAPGEQRPAIVCEDVKSLEIDRLRVPPKGNGSPVIDLRDTQVGWIAAGRAPFKSPSLVHVRGASSSEILISGCDLLGADRAVTMTGDVSPTSITLGDNLTRDTVTHPTGIER